MAQILLENMEFHAYHGCLSHEKQLGNTFLVTIKMQLDTSLAGKSDRLEDTLNYQLVYDVIKREMLQQSALIEHVVQRIFDAVSAEFPQIEHLSVRLTKKNPPLGAKVDGVTIVLEN